MSMHSVCIVAYATILSCRMRIKTILYRLLQNDIIRLCRRFKYGQSIGIRLRQGDRQGHPSFLEKRLFRDFSARPIEGNGDRGRLFLQHSEKQEAALSRMPQALQRHGGRRRAEALFSPSSAKEGVRGLF